MGGRGGHSHRTTAGRGASAIDRLTSITQLNSWLRNQDWFRPGSYISLNGVDLEAARGIGRLDAAGNQLLCREDHLHIDPGVVQCDFLRVRQKNEVVSLDDAAVLGVHLVRILLLRGVEL